MQIVSRRVFLGTGLASGVALTSALRAMPSTPACVLTTEQEEGPYYVDAAKIRKDITEGKPGVPLRLRVALIHAKRCVPLSNAAVDIWHCDAGGVYSGFTEMKMGGPGGFGPPPGGFGGRPPGPPPGGGPGGSGPGGPPPNGFGPPHSHGPMDATRFLRGVQASDASGMVEFATIYPGWYQGRAIHIHMKVHTGGHVSHTGQLFFPEDLTQRIAKMNPYAKHTDVHMTTQSEDMVFEPQHGASGMLTMNRIEPRSDAAGFIATVTLAVDPDATPEPAGRGGPPMTR